jgi:hypothetical protein
MFQLKLLMATGTCPATKTHLHLCISLRALASGNQLMLGYMASLKEAL